jgi:formylglycine-generating enzyme required for sulfatase activity
MIEAAEGFFSGLINPMLFQCRTSFDMVKKENSAFLSFQSCGGLMKLGFFFNAIMVACLLGLAGLASAAEDWKYTESGEVDQGPVDGPPGVMVLIPGGEFTMGDNEGSRNERPEHTVWLDAYLIDRYEVTMAEYQKFLDHDYSIEPPPLWDEKPNGKKPHVERMVGDIPGGICNHL